MALKKETTLHNRQLLFRFVLPAIALVASVSSLGLTDEDRVLLQTAASGTSSAGEQCAYTTLRTDPSGLTKTERFTPGSDPTWVLVQVDSRDPTEDEIDDYEPGNRGNHPAALDLEAAGFEGYVRVDAPAGKAVFGFVPKGEDGDEVEGLVGRMTIDVPTRQIERMHVYAPESFKPAFAVRMERFDQKFTLGYDAEVDGVVMQSMDMDIKGKAMGLKTFEEKFTLQFMDYQCP